MLYISLAVSLFLLVFMNRMAATKDLQPTSGLFACIFTPCMLMCLGIVMPVVAAQGAILFFLIAVALIPRHGRQLYLVLSIGMVVISYGISLKPAVEKYEQYVQFRQEYPLESLEARLPTRPKSSEQPQLANPSWLDSTEKAIDYDAISPRYFSLRAIHEASVDTFVRQPGFGAIRMVRPMQPNKKALDDAGHAATPVPQPDYATPFVHPPLELSKELPVDDAPKLNALHTVGVVDFVNPKGFGYVKDRSRVAGFQAHGMSKVPTSESPWQVAHIELVGLVVHEKPVAYPSQNLPRMEELRKASTRSLDTFENAGLDSLRKGEELYARGTDTKARMLGAIRAAKQCTECHGCNRGDLLGAFSYGLRR